MQEGQEHGLLQVAEEVKHREQLHLEDLLVLKEVHLDEEVGVRNVLSGGLHHHLKISCEHICATVLEEEVTIASVLMKMLIGSSMGLAYARLFWRLS